MLISMLFSARIGLDPVQKRGGISRGAYICDESGARYLTHSGEWTNGIRGDENWWNDAIEARLFLNNAIKKARDLEVTQ